ncbi:hypothetical protein TcasGA2_TC009032 [Tribolium castaneum]|uniref:Uncharacterized protein n=1 Tax=Tribolium castaneum TaxID=7070 RepID=D6WPS0_TRICA|nr:hypothetical protein TcasGA2_TC009032 [Tribolium castaneum]
MGKKKRSRLTYLAPVAVPIITFYYIPCSREVLRISNIRFYSRIRVNIWPVAVHCCPINYIVPIHPPLEIKISGRKDPKNQITDPFAKYLRGAGVDLGVFSRVIIFLLSVTDRCTPSAGILTR